MGGQHVQYPNDQAKGARAPAGITMFLPNKLEVHLGPDNKVHVHDRDAGGKMTVSPKDFRDRFNEMKKKILEEGEAMATLPGNGGALVAAKADDYDDSGKIIYSLQKAKTGFEPLEKFADDLEASGH